MAPIMFRRTLVSVAIALTLAGCAGAADNAALQALHQRIASGAIPNIHSVITLEDGRTIAEWYFEGPDERRGTPLGAVKFGPETLHDIRSATKSVVSLLFGIAYGEGAIKSLDAPALDYFPEYADLQTAERRRIKLRDLLSMTSGLSWDEDTLPYTDPRNSETAMDLAPDRWRYVLSQRVEAAPGTRWRYSGGDVALIGEILQRATRMPLSEFAQAKLFAPMSIENFEWLTDAKGSALAASGLRMLPRDMAKLGEMVRQGGEYNGKRIVPAEWVEASLAAHAIVDTAPGCGTAYGYFWWIGPACPADVGWFSAIGNGGQRIFVVPERGLVIVVTAGLYNSREQRRVREITSAVIAATAPQ